MKKALFTTIALATVLSLSSCGDNSTHTAEISGKDKPQTTTEAVTLADELKEVDIFENCSITIFDAYQDVYPNNLNFCYSTLKSDYKDKVDYGCTITGDCNKIIAEVNVDKDKCNEALKADGLKIEADNKTYEIDLSETKTMLLRKEQLTDEVIETINDSATGIYTDDRRIEKLYALVPKNDTIFFNDFQCTEREDKEGLTGKPKDVKKLPEYQIFAILPDQNDCYKILMFDTKFKNGKIEGACGYIEYGDPRENGRYERTFTKEELDSVFDRMIEEQKEKCENCCECEVLEIPVPSK